MINYICVLIIGLLFGAMFHSLAISKMISEKEDKEKL